MSENDPAGMLASKDYEIQVLEIINSGGQVVDVRKVFLELQVCQDIYASVMSGTLVLNDGNDVFGNFYFCGNEFLKIKIDKPSLKKPLEKIFRIYKATNRAPTSDSSGQIYTLNFCSEEFIMSNSKLVSKAYKSLKVSDVVADIVKNELKIDSSKIRSIETTSGIYDLVVPNYRPMEAIQWLASRAYDASKKFCYFFYEDRDGFNFKSYHSMIKQKPLKELKYEIKRIDQDPATNKDSIDNFSIKNDFDILTSLTNGSFASKLLTVDIIDQSFEVFNYSVSNSEQGNLLLNKFKPVNDYKNIDEKSFAESYDSYFLTYLELNDNSQKRENEISKWLMQRTLHMALMNNFKIQIVIPGDILLKAGDVVNYEFKKFETAKGSGKSNDEYRTGKYLVTAINHKFTGGDGQSFESIVELVTDSFSKQLPGAKNGINKIVQKGK